MREGVGFVRRPPRHQHNMFSLPFVLFIFPICGAFTQIGRCGGRLCTFAAAPLFLDFKALLRVGEESGKWDKAAASAERWLQANDFSKNKQGAAITECISLFSRAGMPDKVLEVIESVQSKNGTLTPLHINAALSSLKHHKRFDACLSLYGQFFREEARAVATASLDKFTPDKFTLSIMIRVCAEQGTNWPLARQLYELAQQGGQRDDVMDADIVTCAQRCGEHEEAQRLSELLAKPRRLAVDSGAPLSRNAWLPLNTLLREARRSGDFRLALDAADSWVAAHKHPYITSLGGLQCAIQIYGEARARDRVLALVDVMGRQCRDHPNQPVSLRNWNTAMVALSQVGKADEAIAVFESLKERDKFSFGAALKARERQGNWQASLDLFAALRAAVPLEEIDAAPFHSLLSCLSKAGQWEALLDVFALMPVSKRTRVTRQIVLQGLGKAGKAELIATMRHELLDEHATDVPRASTSAAVNQPLRAVQRKIGDEVATEEEEEEEREGDEGAEAVQVLQRMPPESKAGTLLDKLREAPAMAGLYSVAKFYASVMRIDEALSLLDELEAGLASSPNSSAQAQGLYNEILKAVTKEGRWQQAGELLRRMVVQKVPRSLTTYQALLRMRREADSVNDEQALAQLEAQAKDDGVDLERLANAKEGK